MGKEHDSNVKDALIAEYSAIRDEIVLRIKQKNAVIGWLIGLTGTFVAAMVALKVGESEVPLLVSILRNVSSETISVATLLLITYAFSIELLLSYWIYQLFQTFHLHRMTSDIERRYAEYLRTPSNVQLFQWDERDRMSGLEKIGSIRRANVRFSLGIVDKIQPLILYGLLTLTIGGVGAVLAIDHFVWEVLPRSITIGFLIFASLQIAGMVLMILIHFALHTWVIAKLESMRPHANIVDDSPSTEQ